MWGKRLVIDLMLGVYKFLLVFSGGLFIDVDLKYIVQVGLGCGLVMFVFFIIEFMDVDVVVQFIKIFVFCWWEEKMGILIVVLLDLWYQNEVKVLKQG